MRTELTNAMFIVAGFACAGVYACWAGSSSRLAASQCRRYALVALGQGILTACAVWLLAFGSVGDITAAVREWFTIPVIGWVVDACLVPVAISPIITVLALLEIPDQPELCEQRIPRRDFVLSWAVP